MLLYQHNDNLYFKKKLSIYTVMGSFVLAILRNDNLPKAKIISIMFIW